MDEKYDQSQVLDVKAPMRQEIQPAIRQNIRWIEPGCKIFGCKGEPLVTDDDRGEIICGCCGSIVAEKSVDATPVRTSDADEFLTKSSSGPGQSLSMYDRGMTTIISNKDALGKPISGSMKNSFIRLKKLDSRSKSRSSNRTLRSSLLFLDILETNLGLPDSVTESAAYIYRKAMQKKITVGRNARCLMCASVYAACRQNNIPRSITDVCNAASMKKKEVSQAYRKLVSGLGMSLSHCHPTEYVAKIANETKISKKTCRDALNMLKRLTDEELTDGKNPMVLAGAALYSSCLLNRENVTQEDIARACGVTSSAIRIRYYVLKKHVVQDNNTGHAQRPQK